MVNKAWETDPEYTRVYVINVEVASTDITVSSATPAVVAIPACTAGQIVQVYMPKTKNGAYSVQQAIQMKVSTRIRMEVSRAIENIQKERSVARMMADTDVSQPLGLLESSFEKSPDSFLY